MSWKVPLSSSPLAPSTPGSDKRHTRLFAKSPSRLPSNPSTTPAGPTPSSIGSFTPTDPPPSSMFGSSQLGSGKTLFKSKAPGNANSNSKQSNNPFSRSIDQGKLARYLHKNGGFDFGDSNGASARRIFGLPSGKRRIDPTRGSDEEYEESGDSDEEEDEEGSMEEATSDVGSLLDKSLLDVDSTTHSPPNTPPPNAALVDRGSSIMSRPPRGVKRSRGGATISQALTRSAKGPTEPPGESAIPSIVHNLVSHSRSARLHEPDEFIIAGENILQELQGIEKMSEAREKALDCRLPITTEKLCGFWRTFRDGEAAKIPFRAEAMAGIGPDEEFPPSHKAIFISTLLLQLRHPPTAKGKQALAVARLNRLSTSATFPQEIQLPSNPTAFPKVLLAWLDNNHHHYQPMIVEVQKCNPSPIAHTNYWHIIFQLTLRGKLADVGRLLTGSDFQYARTAIDDGQGKKGYHGLQIKNIERVVNRAIQVLEYSPSLREDNWNLTGNDWSLFRKRIEQAMDDLTTFAEGRDRDTDALDSTFEASNFGLRKANMGLSQSARRAESKVPWTIYQNLKSMYGILLGGTTEIISNAQDWVEATIGLAAWWDGDDVEDVASRSMVMSRRSLRHSQSRGQRLVDINPVAAYHRRLAYAFEHVSQQIDDQGEKMFEVNSINQVELALASVFQGNVEGVIGLLRGWSLPVCSASAEIASAGGWFVSQPGSDIMDLFDDNDLIAMGRSRQQQPIKPMTKDSILLEYAEALSARERIQARQGLIYEGWELSISVLNRLDDKGTTAQRVGALLQHLDVHSDQRMDKILRICEAFGIPGEARSITEKYADRVAENTENYGTALIYYARAHCTKKLKDVLDLLISLSLVQSTAFPPLKSLDPNLHALIFTPELSLSQLAEIDKKAAEMLHAHLTGYATLRRFYDLRDAEVNVEDDQKAILRPITRRAAAATALLAVINSAADSIHGGLYDEHRGSIVQVDGLLALLGEAMVFVNQPKRVLSLRQCFTLLKAIEDLQTVTSRVYSQCEECLRSTLAAFAGRGAPASPRQLLKKTTSSMTSAGSFSLVGSSMLESELSAGSGSRALVKSGEEQSRGWDWRKGLAKDATGEDILRILRLGLAKDIAKHWLMEEGA